MWFEDPPDTTTKKIRVGLSNRCNICIVQIHSSGSVLVDDAVRTAPTL